MTAPFDQAMFRPSLGERVRDSFFWLRDGRGLGDKLRLLRCWLSPHLGGHRPREPVPVATPYVPSRPVHLRPNSTDASVLRHVFGRDRYALPAGWTGDVESVVDLGANNGIATLFFAVRHPDARILAVEPDASSHACLCVNVEGLPQVATRRACVADRTGVVRFENQGPSDGHRIAADGGVEVPAETLVDLLDEAGLDRVSLLKMDIEGAERMVLESVGDWIGRVGWAIIDFHFDSVDLAAAREALLGHDRLLFCRVTGGRWREIDEAGARLLPTLVDTLDVLVAPAEAAQRFLR